MDLQDILKVGQSMGLEGSDLRKFVEEQQQILREERAKERDAKRLLVEAEQRDKEREAEQRDKERDIQFKLETLKMEGKVQKNNNPSHVLPNLAKFDARCEDIDSYIERFERVVKLSKLDLEIWAISLGSLLTGRALEVYSGLPVSVANDYQQLKLALLKAFGSNAEGFRRKFKESEPLKLESGQQYIMRLKTYLKRWLELSGVEEDYSGLFNFFSPRSVSGNHSRKNQSFFE